MVGNIARSFPDDDSFDNFITFAKMEETKSPASFHTRLSSISQKRSEQRNESLIECFQTREYTAMLNQLEREKFRDDNGLFLSALKDNGFFLPSLEGDLDLDEWRYANEMAVFASKKHLQEDFLNLLDELQKSK